MSGALQWTEAYRFDDEETGITCIITRATLESGVHIYSYLVGMAMPGSARVLPYVRVRYAFENYSQPECPPPSFDYEGITKRLVGEACQWIRREVAEQYDTGRSVRQKARQKKSASA